MSDRPRRALEEIDFEPFAKSDLESTAVRRAINMDTAEIEPIHLRPARRAALIDGGERASSAEVGVSPSVSVGAATSVPDPAVASHSAAKPVSAPPGWVDCGVIVAVTVCCLVTAALTPSMSAWRDATVPLVSAVTKICPDANGQLDAVTSAGSYRREKAPEATLITPEDPQASIAGGRLVDAEGSLRWVACVVPATDQVVHFSGAKGTALRIINVGSAPAIVDVTLSGPDGQIMGEGLRGLTLAADSREDFDIASLAGDVDVVGARIRTSTGRVVAHATQLNDGAESSHPTRMATKILVPTIPADATSVRLIVTNPGTGRERVTVSALTQAGPRELPDLIDKAVDAQRTIAFDVDLAGQANSLIVTSKNPVAVSVVATIDSDRVVLPGEVTPSQREADLMGAVPGAGMLYLANPEQTEATATVDWGSGTESHPVAAGALRSVSIPRGAAHITVAGDVAAWLIIVDGGATFVPLDPGTPKDRSVPVGVDAGMGR